MFPLCVMPAEMHPVALSALIEWWEGRIPDIALVYYMSMVDSELLELAECLILHGYI